MEKHYLYVLLSEKDKRFYIGITNDLQARIDRHNRGNVKSTSKRLPLKLIYYECYKLKSDALRNEKYYKTTKGREDLRKKLKDCLGL